MNYIIIQSCPSGPTGSSLFNLVTSKSFANKIKAVISFLNFSSLFMQSQTNQMQCLKQNMAMLLNKTTTVHVFI